MIQTHQKIAILGSGITAQAVLAAANRLELSVVPPQEADLVVASPGIHPATFPKVSVEIISEIEFAYRYLVQQQPYTRFIGITGTNGKSTVTAMVAHVLDCPMAGNIGIPLAQYIPHKDAISCVSPSPTYAIELSSYQLETCVTFRPDIAIVLGLTPDHIDRHPTMPDYTAAKQKLVSQQRPRDLVIYDPKNPWSHQIAQSSTAKKQALDAHHPLYQAIAKMVHDNADPERCLGLIGAHNIQNALAAALAAQEFKISTASILEKLATYRPLPHRIEYITTHKGCRIFNDSKATNPESTLVALAAFDAPIHLILGGKDKGLALTSFVTAVAKQAASVSIFGEIASRMAQAFQEIGYTPTTTQTLDAALDASLSLAQPGDVLLFSPACSSFDQFQNFEHRGQIFREIIQSKGKTPHV